jgi:hypothetical protein
VPRSSASSSAGVTRANSGAPVVSITGRSSSTAAGAGVDGGSGRRSSSSSGAAGATAGEGTDDSNYVPMGKPVCSKCKCTGIGAMHGLIWQPTVVSFLKTCVGCVRKRVAAQTRGIGVARSGCLSPVVRFVYHDWLTCAYVLVV